jgi:N-acetylglucosamine kinase-like BadF-type ATPase
MSADSPLGIVFAGMDAGGTSVDIRYLRGDVEGELHLPGVNIRRDGVDKAVDRLAAAIVATVEASATAASVDQPVERIVAAIGAAGAGDAETCRSVESRLRRALVGGNVGGLTVLVMSDAELALIAAHGAEPGAVVIVGTGSAALMRRRDGSIVRRGGLGYLLGDEASGYAIGLAAARYYARSIDRGEDGALATRLAGALGAQTRASIITTVYDGTFPLQNLASVVLDAFAAGDPDAARIVEAELRELAKTLASLDHESDPGGVGFCVSGGLTAHPKFVDAMQRIAMPPTWKRVEPASESAAEAALVIAQGLGERYAGQPLA